MKNYYILLYYCYTKIEDPELFKEEHHQFCLDNNILGRIIIASEGLNGTVSGLKEDCEKYMAHVKADARFDKLEFKIEEHDEHGFKKLHVRIKPEIVHSGFSYVDPTKKTGIHLEPHQFKAMKDDEDVVVLDCRSSYEYNLGKFNNAETMEIDNFRDIPAHIDELKEKYKGKKIVTYCTGGIKCEKASAYLLDQGFENVYQLHGGIIKYGTEQGGEDFDGKCYVFDNRIGADINKVNPVVVSECHICHTKSDRMVNCCNPSCNIHVAICESCGWELDGACSVECQSNENRRPYDGTGYYQKNTNGYNPYIGFYRKKDFL
ncbi:MAG: rhodanese-related sulfurtransferase [Cyclobacteriaceae bacterium]|nr:rhodanese-related sulfurtransferase [Cyclobacteriaceae bacterium]